MCLDEQGEENGDGVDVRSNVQLAVLRIKLMTGARCRVSVPVPAMAPGGGKRQRMPSASSG